MSDLLDGAEVMLTRLPREAGELRVVLRYAKGAPYVAIVFDRADGKAPSVGLQLAELPMVVMGLFRAVVIAHQPRRGGAAKDG
jgi:hypothetical protein